MITCTHFLINETTNEPRKIIEIQGTFGKQITQKQNGYLKLHPYLDMALIPIEKIKDFKPAELY